MTIWFVLAALGLVVVAWGCFLPWLRRSEVSRELSRAAVNLAIYRQRRSELEADLAESTVDAEAGAQAELDRLLLDELAPLPTASEPVSGRLGRAPVWVALGAMPLLAVGLYLTLGRPDALTTPPAQASDTAPQLMRAAIERLAAQLQNDPNNLQGWLLLARSYQATQQPAPALLALERALQLAPDNLDVKAQYAMLLGESNGGNYRGKPYAIVQEVLQRNPNHPTALWLAGFAAAQQGDNAAALGYWQTLLARIPPEETAHQQLQQAIAQLQDRTTAPSVAPVAVRVLVKLAPPLAAQVSPDDTLFVFAKAATGPAMPLAVVKRKASELPVQVTLDDSMAMTPAAKLSGYDEVLISARVSKQGSPQAQSGDLEGVVRSKVAAGVAVDVEINRVLP